MVFTWGTQDRDWWKKTPRYWMVGDEWIEKVDDESGG
jgi:hypothetical protein